MLLATLFSLIAVIFLPVLAVQVPLIPTGSHRGRQEESLPAIKEHEDLTHWRLDQLPDSNATDHLVFETVHSLLQHWPNTRMRNGERFVCRCHNIVPGHIPKGALLYHGRNTEEMPTGPEWTATDPEHANVFCRNSFEGPQQGCWQLTFMTTRPLKIVYFDGSSAVKMYKGPADTQDLIAWGREGDGDLFEDEVKRAQDLCRWGKDFGVDGLVRMEMDFEIILCNFASGVRVVSFVNLVTRLSARSPINSSEAFEVLNAGSWHNHFPGETRILLDLPGLVSFYDSQLVPSLVPIRAGQERWNHRAINISKDELLVVKSKLEANLIRREDVSSGIPWKTLIQVVVDRYAERLELTHYLLNSSAMTDPHDILNCTKRAQTQLRIMLTPYMLLSATPDNPSDKDNLEWTIPMYKLCSTTHTYSMDAELTTDSEKLLLRAVRTTTREICRVVTKMWATGVSAGIDPLLNTKTSHDISEITSLRSAWIAELDRLMTWLDWSVWVKCNPGCGPEEMCYLPTWPFGFPYVPPNKLKTSFEVRRIAGKGPQWNYPDEWVRPQPKCIPRTEPYYEP